MAEFHFACSISIFSMAREIANSTEHFICDVQLTAAQSRTCKSVQLHVEQAAINRNDFKNSIEHWFMDCVIFLSNSMANLWPAYGKRINQNQTHTHTFHLSFQFESQFWPSKDLIVSFPALSLHFVFYFRSAKKWTKKSIRESGGIRRLFHRSRFHVSTAVVDFCVSARIGFGRFAVICLGTKRNVKCNKFSRLCDFTVVVSLTRQVTVETLQPTYGI